MLIQMLAIVTSGFTGLLIMDKYKSTGRALLTSTVIYLLISVLPLFITFLTSFKVVLPDLSI
jgi:hypothetical protein